MKQHAGKVTVLKQVLENVKNLRMQERRLGELACSRRSGQDENS